MGLGIRQNERNLAVAEGDPDDEARRAFPLNQASANDLIVASNMRIC